MSELGSKGTYNGSDIFSGAGLDAACRSLRTRRRPVLDVLREAPGHWQTVSFYRMVVCKTNGDIRGQNTSEASEMAASICLQTSMTGLLRSPRGSGTATPWTPDAAAAKNKGVTTFKSIGPAKKGSKPRG